MNPEHLKTSKFLSYVLRHRPDSIGLVLDGAGWASINELIRKARSAGKKLSRTLIEEVVANNDKQRFALSADGERIRASQGHSVDIDLDLKPLQPPEVLYHGTATRFLESIMARGLQPGSRRHVHLSADIGTARKVGQRHGKPVILELDARAMHQAGLVFFRADNGVWLTAHVPPAFLRRLPEHD